VAFELMTGTSNLVGASGGDRTAKAVVFWLVIILVVGAITFAVRRVRRTRAKGSALGGFDDWQRDERLPEQERSRQWR
jgi:hypothetical protein